MRSRNRPFEKTLLNVGGALLLTAVSGEPPGMTAPPAAELETAAGERLRVRQGDVIPGLGEVKRIDDATIIIERVLTGEERAELHRRGVLAPDVEKRIYHRHESLGVVEFRRRN